jgi:hypothetical protein
MTPGELFDAIRDHFLRRFGTHLDELITAGKSVAVEPAFRDATGKVVREGRLGLPARSDVIVIEEGKAAEAHLVETQTHLSFEKFEFDWEGLRVTVRPFRWDDCHVTLQRSRATEYEPLVKWFEKWFRESEDGDEESFLGAVHFLSDPSENGASTTVTVDFGSAPVEALEEFLDAVRALAASEVALGQEGDAA